MADVQPIEHVKIFDFHGSKFADIKLFGFYPTEEEAIRAVITFGKRVRREAEGKLAELHRQRLTEKLNGGAGEAPDPHIYED